MRFISFNVNGIRARLHQLHELDRKHQPDVVAIQESKVVDAEFPMEAVQEAGFPHCYIYGQKGHYGVALLSKKPLQDVQLGYPWRAEDQQRRFIAATFKHGRSNIRIINGYFPQGDSRTHEVKFPAKAEYYADLHRYLSEHCDPKDRLIVAGDMNVAPDDLDIGIGEDNKKRWLKSGKASFLPEEREWLAKISDWGLLDSYALDNPDQRDYSWFDYRSRGFEREPKRGLRIDLIMVSKALQAKMAGTGIDYEMRSSEKPSDHCPIWCDFS
ncbi:MAG: exodeoxyribonuclease III [Pseudomonadales bacterium]